MNYRARLDATSEAVEAAALARINELEADVAALKRARDLAILRMQEATSYCIELRERLNRYELGVPMILNAPTLPDNGQGKRLAVGKSA